MVVYLIAAQFRANSRHGGSYDVTQGSRNRGANFESGRARGCRPGTVGSIGIRTAAAYRVRSTSNGLSWSWGYLSLQPAVSQPKGLHRCGPRVQRSARGLLSV